MNSSLVRELTAVGHKIKLEDTRVELSGFESSSVIVNESITIPFVEFLFPSGVKIETNVSFLIFPTPATMQPEILICNKFLKERFQFNIIERLDTSIEENIGFDKSLPEVPFNENDPYANDIRYTVNACNTHFVDNEVKPDTPFPAKPTAIELDLIETDCFDDPAVHNKDDIPLHIDVALCRAVQAHCHPQNNIVEKVAPSCLDKLKPPSIESSHEWNHLKVQLLTQMSSKENVTIRIESDKVLVDTSNASYLLSRNLLEENNDSSLATMKLPKARPKPVSLDTNLAGTVGTPEGWKNPDSVVQLPTQMENRGRSKEYLNKYSSPSILESSITLPSSDSPSLDNLDDKEASHSTVHSVSGYDPNDSKIDISDMMPVSQLEAYKRRHKVVKARVFAQAARYQIPRTEIPKDLLDTIHISSDDLTELVRANRDKFHVDTSKMEEMDPTIKKNPKAFWFGEPHTEAESQAFIDERMENARLNLAHDPEITPQKLQQLRDIVERNRNHLRTRLGNDMISSLDALKVELKPGAHPKKTNLYRQSANAEQQMTQQTKELEKAGLIQRVPNTAWLASAQMVPKPGGFPNELRMVIDYKWINICTQNIQGPMTRLPEAFRQVAGAKYFFCGDFLKGFYQCLLHPDSRKYYAFCTNQGTYVPTRVPQGCSESPLHFHGQLAQAFSELIESKNMILYIDDCLLHAKSWEEYLSIVEKFFDICKKYNLQVNIKKTTLASDRAIFCGREVSGTGVKYQARNTDTFLNMPIPLEAGSLSQFLMGMNWIRDGLLSNGPLDSFASISAPLWKMMEQVYVKAKGNQKRLYKNVKLADCGWNEVHTNAFNRLKEKLANHCIEHSFPIPGAKLCLFSDASDHFYSAMLTQVINWDETKPVQEQCHSPLASLSGEFKNSEMNWRIIEKEAYPLILALQEWDYHLRTPEEGFAVYVDHKNLVHLFSPESITPPLSKGAMLRVYNWLYLLGQYKVHTMEHLMGENNTWADYLSRDGNANFYVNKNSQVTSLKTKVNAIRTGSKRKRKEIIDKNEIINLSLHLQYDHGAPKTERVSIDLIKAAQIDLSVDDTAYLINNPNLKERELDGLIVFYAEGKNTNRIWIPDDHHELMVRLCIGAHCGLESGHSEPGHRGYKTTLSYLTEYVWWNNMDEFVKTFVSTCLCCLKDKASNTTIPRPLAHMMKATERGQILTFDYMQIGESRETDLHNYQYILVLKDMFSHYVEFIPTPTCDSIHAADAIAWWIARFKKPEWLISDNGSHFTAKVVAQLAEAFDVRHHFVEAYCSWSNGSVERCNREIKSLLKVVLSEGGREWQDWPYLLPAVMSTVNQQPSITLGGHTPKEVYLGLDKYNPYNVIFAKRDIPTIQEISIEKYQSHVTKLTAVIQSLHREVVISTEQRQAENARSNNTRHVVRLRRAQELGVRIGDVTDEMCLPKFRPGELVLVAQARLTNLKKLHAIWRGPYKVLTEINTHVYEVEHLLNGSSMTAHITRMRFYSDSEIDIPVPLMKRLETESHLSYTYNVENILDHRYESSVDAYQLQIKWLGLSDLENTWQDIRELYEDVPHLVSNYVLTLPKTDKLRSALKRRLLAKA